MDRKPDRAYPIIAKSISAETPSSARFTALYESCLIAFSAPISFVIPQSALLEDGYAILAASAARFEPEIVPLKTISRVVVDTKGPTTRLQVDSADSSTVWVELDSRHSEEVLRRLADLLQGRLVTGTLASTKPRKSLRKSWSLWIAIVVMLVIVLSSSDDGNGVRLWLRLAIGTALAFLASQVVDRSTAALQRFWQRRVRRAVRSRRERPAPWRSPAFGLILKATGLMLAVTAFWLDDILTTTWQALVDNHVSFTVSSRLSPFLQLAKVLVYFPAAYSIYFGYRLALKPAKAAERGDARPPVLFLRSFDDDGRTNLNPSGFLATFLGLHPIRALRPFGPAANVHPIRLLRLLTSRTVDTAEEQLAACLRKKGPFVAIGRPNEYVATGGAARMYVGDHEWRDVVRAYLHRAQIVVIYPGESEGIWWEIMEAVHAEAIHKVLFCLSEFREAPEQYNDFRKRLEELIGTPIPRHFDDSLFLFIDTQKNARLLPTVWRDPIVWPLVGCAVDLDRTLAPFWHHAIDDAGSETTPADDGLNWWAASIVAVCLWGCTGFAAPAMLNWIGGSYFRPVVTMAGMSWRLRAENPMAQYKLGEGPHAIRLNDGWTPTLLRGQHLGNENVYSLARDAFLGASWTETTSFGRTPSLEDMSETAIASLKETFEGGSPDSVWSSFGGVRSTPEVRLIQERRDVVPKDGSVWMRTWLRCLRSEAGGPFEDMGKRAAVFVSSRNRGFITVWFALEASPRSFEETVVDKTWRTLKIVDDP